MNFASFKEFRQNSGTSLKDIVRYLSVELAATIRELRTGLLRLNFDDNFESFKVIVDIPASSEAMITNQLDVIPSGYLITRRDEGGLSVCDGDTAWTVELLYLKNTSASLSASVTVTFFR